MILFLITPYQCLPDSFQTRSMTASNCRVNLSCRRSSPFLNIICISFVAFGVSISIQFVSCEEDIAVARPEILKLLLLLLSVAAFSKQSDCGRILEFISLHLSNRIRLHFWFGFRGLTKLRYGWYP